MSLRVAAISFLNPAPLLYNFEHHPAAVDLLTRYDVHYTLPSRCAAELHAGEADLGLIPIAELTPSLAIVPGCTIASRREVRSILLLIRNRGNRPLAEALGALNVVAADNASRSSAAYVRVILQRFYGARVQTEQHDPDPLRMLAEHRAALLIGDHALLAREHRAEIDAAVSAEGDSLLWLDIAQLWRQHTGLPWVAAVWAVRPEAIAASGLTPQQLTTDLNRSREAGLAHIEQLVAEWTPKLPIPAGTIRTYLTDNIYYQLDEPCLEALRLFRGWAAELGVLPALGEPNLLRP